MFRTDNQMTYTELIVKVYGDNMRDDNMKATVDKFENCMKYTWGKLQWTLVDGEHVHVCACLIRLQKYNMGSRRLLADSTAIVAVQRCLCKFASFFLSSFCLKVSTG